MTILAVSSMSGQSAQAASVARVIYIVDMSLPLSRDFTIVSFDVFAYTHHYSVTDF